MKGKTEKLFALLLAVVIVVFSSWLFYQDFVAPRPVVYPAASDGVPTKARISFAQGHAVLEFYDTPMAWEFTERQPIVLQLERRGTISSCRASRPSTRRHRISRAWLRKWATSPSTNRAWKSSFSVKKKPGRMTGFLWDGSSAA